MASIPTVPGSSQIQTPEAAVKTDFGALNAPNRAQMGLAGTIQGVGDAIGQFNRQLQDAKNFGLAADADRQMRQATADFQASRAGRTDEDNWGNEWKDRATTVRDNILSQQGVGSDLRRVLDNNLKNWNQSNSIEVATIAKKQMINRAVERGTLAANAAAEAGDEQGVVNAIAPLAKIGAVYPEKAQMLIKANLDMLDKYKADNFIEAHPPQAIDWLGEKDASGNYVNAPRLNPDQRRIMMVNAEKRARAFQSDNYDDAKLDIDNGVIPSTDQILARENKGDYSARQAAGLRTYIKVKGSQPKIENQPQYAANVATAINAIPAGLDVDARRKYITDIVTSKEYLSLMEPVRKVFDDQMKQDATQLRPVEAETLKRAEEAYRNGMFLPRAMEEGSSGSGKLHWIGPLQWAYEPGVDEKKVGEKADLGADNPDADASHWTKTAPRSIVDATQMHYADYLTKMRYFFKENPKASDSDAAKESQRLMEPYTMAAVTAALKPARTARNVTQAEYEALKSGETYYWNGQPLTKK